MDVNFNKKTSNINFSAIVTQSLHPIFKISKTGAAIVIIVIIIVIIVIVIVIHAAPQPPNI